MIKNIITSKTRRELLTLFLTNPKTRFYIRELARKTHEYVHSVRKELNNLESAGIISSESIANLKYYKTNQNCIIYNELRSIILKTNPAEILLSKTLESLKQTFQKNLSSVILFGSLAKNDLKFNDIDLLVIAEELPKDWRKRDEIISEIGKIGLKHGTALHIELITDEELKFSVNQGAPLLFGLAAAHRILYDNSLFKKQINIFKKNMERWNAKKTNNILEVPELAVKI